VTDQPAAGLTLTAAEGELDRRLDDLPAGAQAAFYAWAARGLLPVYERFARRQAWGDVPTLRRSIELAERFAAGKELRDAKEVSDLVEALERAAPHADDFDDPDTTGAQDALIAADVALRAVRGQGVAGMAMYVLEHASEVVTVQRTGSTGPGSGPEADAWDREIMSDSSMRAAMAAVDAALSSLEAGRPLDADAGALDPT
jgi:uncharacterized protein YjaG (DUF416 family)